MFSLGNHVCQGSPKALRNLLQAYHKKGFADMVKEEEEEEEKENKFKVPHKGKNEVFPTVALWAVSCFIQIWAGLFCRRQCGQPQEEGQVESWEGGGPRGGEMQLEVA